jgi:hypothetical protein
MDFLGIPSKTQRAIVRCAQRAAARIVRGSSPSGKNDSFLESSRALGDPVTEGRRGHPGFPGVTECEATNPHRYSAPVIHSELDALKIVLRHFRARLTEQGSGLPAIGLGAHDGETRFKPWPAKIPHTLIQLEFSCQHQSRHRRFQSGERDSHHHIAAIDRRDQY